MMNPPASAIETTANLISGRPDTPVNLRIFYWSLIAALAGFLFGFDTVVISGAEQKIQVLWKLSAEAHGIAMASALYGTVIGALLGGWPTDRFGRKPTLFWIGILFVVSALGTAFATNVNLFIFARMIGGVGIGISTVVAPLYISEISPPKYRGRLAAMFQFNIVFGIIVAFASNACLAGMGENDWRWMLGVAAIPSLIYTFCCPGLPESPRWLLFHKKDRKAATDVLHLIYPAATPAELEAEADQIDTASTGTKASARFWSWRLRVPILMAFLVAFFNQLSGINAVLYFAPRIFALSGLGAKAALLQSVGIGLTNLVGIIVGLALIDRLGRRTLLTIGSFGYIISLGLVSWAFFTSHLSIVPICIFAFVGAHSVGQGTVIWVLISEIFPNQQRAEGQALGGFTHWIFAALVTTFFPSVVTFFHPGYIFLFFCGMMVLHLIWVRTMLIETKGASLEEIQKKLGIQ